MVIEIPKGSSEKQVKRILQKRITKKFPNKSLEDFFGKLPHVEDGLKFQKKVRNEW